MHCPNFMTQFNLLTTNKCIGNEIKARSKNLVLDHESYNIIPWYHFEPDCSCIKHNLLTIKQNKGGAYSRHKHYQLIERKIFIFHFLCLNIDVNNFYLTDVTRFYLVCISKQVVGQGKNAFLCFFSLILSFNFLWCTLIIYYFEW